MGLRLAAAATLGIGLCLSACAQQSAGPSAKSLSAEQDACFAAGEKRDGEGALRHCTNALQATDLTAEMRAATLGIRGMGYALKNDCDRAITDLTEAISLAPSLAQPFAGRGWCYHRKGDFERAMPDFDQAIALSPGYADAYASRGWLFLRLNESDEALEDFSKAARLDPQSSDALDGRGIAQAQKGDYGPALASLNAALRLEPDNHVAYNDRGLIQLLNGQWQSAVDDTSKAITLAPDPMISYENRGTALYVGGEYRRALADMERAQALDPGNPFPYLWLYMTYWRLGESPDAKVREANTDRGWPNVVLRYYQGDATEQDVLAEVKHPKPFMARKRDCQAAIFFAARDRAEGHLDAARRKLEHARDTCPLDQFERAVAIAELRRL